MILAIETSTAMCSVALLHGDAVVDARAERIGRGHAEKLVPMIEALLGPRIPNHILASVGPGSFTGIRVGLAAAQGLAIGWNVSLAGFSSLAVIAAAARAARPDADRITSVMQGGHGELFVQPFGGRSLKALEAPQSLRPEAAAATLEADLVAGPAVDALTEAGATIEAITLDPLADHAALLPAPLRELDLAPLYVRAPDAKPKAA
ncbi:tRNA (adenosine(37)-N6)-threonylcarbamoyltransferase complex dimerization subunit type 1 TsaB [Sphingomicrobium arenosum]|uniref:tRNA (adenosine(37)-N6)-threonylcarbamoyltransferase complex dimerization subunit type 1 TsaB n=1 Tax=Sphingomicrobium arenosum TaxID=2233861 RepID=UPI00223F9B74|nr:tRNA (adenosine(37)-N6)-threonylcarbamoyltransferase complex dimerization subunit type 1 TsaB [Sphingomicrobium arenosum]